MTAPVGVDDWASPWAGTTPVAPLTTTEGAVTLVEGQTFALSGRSGDVSPEHPHGLFVLDTRVLSTFQVRLNGHPVEPLTVAVTEPFAAMFVCRGRPGEGQADADVICVRHRHIGDGMRERIVVTNHGLDPHHVLVEVHCDVDFADLFEVKESRVQRRGAHRYEADGDALRFGHVLGDHRREVVLTAPGGGTPERGRLAWDLTLPPGGTWEVCVQLAVEVNGRALPSRFACGEPDHVVEPAPVRRLADWRARFPRVNCDDHTLEAAVRRSGEDLGALRIFDPAHPDVAIVAAGAPWFMTVFGRDSLLTALMALPADHALACGVLETLARSQGSRVDDTTEEEPGKVLHEIRFGAADGLALGGGDIYYGSVDATPLFVVLLGELAIWQPGDACIERLLPAADLAVEWLRTHGDRDGDGYVEYQRRSPAGLVNQGWKDSWDAIRWADGRLATGPIALCEVQGYVYAALLARAQLATDGSDDTLAAALRDEAAELKRRFNADFWLPDRGCFALALDGDKRPVDAMASNVGHCLWTGIVDDELAPHVARQLLSNGSFSGWGVRTLDATMTAYNPVSYHNGSVWPHDNAICAAGLARYGFHEEAHAVIRAQLDVAHHFSARLPELFAGFGRADVPVPASYPTSCSPQAWASASPLLWLRTILGLDPTRPGFVDPHVPSWVGELRVEGLHVGGRRLTVHVDGSGTVVDDGDAASG